MPQLSAIVITRNEAANIGECLDSLAFCDERIVVDCGFPLVALVTRHAREEMALAEGMSIVAAIKATAIHMVARD